jgi:hypothetical protein
MVVRFRSAPVPLPRGALGAGGIEQEDGKREEGREREQGENKEMGR